MGGSGGWFRRRVVDADLRDSDVVASTGAGVYRFGEYLEDSRGGRWYWLVAAVAQLALAVALPLLVAWGMWSRPDLDRGDPVRVGIVVLVAVVSWWFALLCQGSVRALVRNLPAARRPGD